MLARLTTSSAPRVHELDRARVAVLLLIVAVVATFWTFIALLISELAA